MKHEETGRDILELTEIAECARAACEELIDEGPTMRDSEGGLYCSNGCRMMHVFETAMPLFTNAVHVLYK